MPKRKVRCFSRCRVEINPSIMNGKPVIAGTRIPVELLIRKMREGMSRAEILKSYPILTDEDMLAVEKIREKSA